MATGKILTSMTGILTQNNVKHVDFYKSNADEFRARITNTDDSFDYLTLASMSGTKQNTIVLHGYGMGIYTNVHGVASFYWDFPNLDNTKSTVECGTLESSFRPIAPWYVSPLYDGNQPYTPIGTLWISREGTVTIYKPTSITHGYACGCYLTSG